MEKMGGSKNDTGKARWDLVPWHALKAVVMVLGFGASKYGDHNWKRGLEYSRLFAASQRHVIAFWGGEDNDEESGLPHLAHAICCLLFLLSYRVFGWGEDDR